MGMGIEMPSPRQPWFVVVVCKPLKFTGQNCVVLKLRPVLRNYRSNNNKNGNDNDNDNKSSSNNSNHQHNNNDNAKKDNKANE